MYKSEFHVHTRYSKDSILPLFIILLILKIKKINTVVITDHNEIKGAIKAKDKFERYNINVIIGEEISTSCGEIIGLNLSNKIEPNQTPKETIKKIKGQNGYVYIPHPYDEKRRKTVLIEKEIAKNSNDIDFIEIHNGRNILPEFTKKQEDISKKYNITPIIGSDAHTFFELGRNIIITDEKLDANNLLQNKNYFKFKKKDCILFTHFCTKYIKIIKLIFGGNYNEFFRIINRKITRGK